MVNVAALARTAAIESSGVVTKSHVATEWVKNAAIATKLGDYDTAHHFATAARGDIQMLIAAEPSRIPGAVGAIADQATAAIAGSNAISRLDDGIRLLAAGSDDTAAILGSLGDAWRVLKLTTSDARQAVTALSLPGA